VGVQPLNSNLSAISGLTAAADQFIYFTSASVAALAPVTALGRSVLAASTQGAAQTTLGLGTLSLQNSGAVSITGGAIAGLSSLDVNGDVNLGADTSSTHAIQGKVTVSGPANAGGNNFNLGPLYLTSGSTTVGNVCRLGLGSQSGAGLVMLDAELQNSDRSDFVVRTRGVDSMGERLRVTESGAVKLPGIATTASGANAYLNAADGNSLLRSTSSARYKRDIESVEPSYADAILGLDPVWYRSAAEADNPAWSWWGLIAEDAAKVDPRLVHWIYPDDAYEPTASQDPGGQSGRRLKPDAAPTQPDGVLYDRLAVLLLDVVKRQQKRIEALEARLGS
jgi:hypothetical protein